MSEGKENQNHCKWCDTFGNVVVKVFEYGVLVWVGCPDCSVKKKKSEKNNDPK